MYSEYEFDELLEDIDQCFLTHTEVTHEETHDDALADVTTSTIQVNGVLEFMRFIDWLECREGKDSGDDVIKMLQNNIVFVTDPQHNDHITKVAFNNQLKKTNNCFKPMPERSVDIVSEEATPLLAVIFGQFRDMSVVLKFKQCPYEDDEYDVGYQLLSMSLIQQLPAVTHLTAEHIESMIRLKYIGEHKQN